MDSTQIRLIDIVFKLTLTKIKDKRPILAAVLT